MEERRINKLHGCLIEDNRVPELIQKMGSGGGLQPIELSAATDDSGNIYIENMTDEIWGQLKTGNYYVKLTIPATEEVVYHCNLYITNFISGNDIGFENTEFISTIPGSLGPSKVITLMKGKLDGTEETRTVVVNDKVGYNPNVVGEITQGEYIRYIASSNLLFGPDTALYNSSWHVGDIIWDTNKTGFSFSESNINSYWGTTYLRLGNSNSNMGGITLLLKLTVNNIDYTLINQNNTTSSFTIINDDLSITVVSCKSTYGYDECMLEFKAVKDKTDITETFKNSITNISLYAL